MADKASKYDLRNTSKGIRGVNAVSGYREFGPGEVAEGVELSDAEYESAKRTGYFEFGAAAKAEAEDETDDALPGNVPKLKKLAREEGIDLGTATSAADIQAVILSARAAKAAGSGIPPSTPPADDLDAMSDADLRDTVQAITGKPAPDGSDREALLKLARGQE